MPSTRWLHSGSVVRLNIADNREVLHCKAVKGDVILHIKITGFILSSITWLSVWMSQILIHSIFLFILCCFITRNTIVQTTLTLQFKDSAIEISKSVPYWQLFVPIDFYSYQFHRTLLKHPVHRKEIIYEYIMIKSKHHLMKACVM